MENHFDKHPDPKILAPVQDQLYPAFVGVSPAFFGVIHQLILSFVDVFTN